MTIKHTHRYGCSDLTQQQYHKMFHADFENGHLYRRKKDGSIGKKVPGTPCKHTGYCFVHVKKPDGKAAKSYVHRVLFIMAHGAIELGLFIDHIDGDKTNNALSNLQKVPPMINSSMRRDNSSGYTGVTWHKIIGKWQVCITIDGNYKFIGYFTDPFEGYKAYRARVFSLTGMYPKGDDQLINSK